MNFPSAHRPPASIGVNEPHIDPSAHWPLTHQPIVHEVAPKLANSFPKIVPKSAQRWSEVGPKLVQSQSEIGPKSIQSPNSEHCSPFTRTAEQGQSVHCSTDHEQSRTRTRRIESNRAEHFVSSTPNNRTAEQRRTAEQPYPNSEHSYRTLLGAITYVCSDVLSFMICKLSHKPNKSTSWTG